jgi:hypothetical protein
VLHTRRDVAVQVGRHRDAGVPKPFLHDLDKAAWAALGRGRPVEAPELP